MTHISFWKAFTSLARQAMPSRNNLTGDSGSLCHGSNPCEAGCSNAANQTLNRDILRKAYESLAESFDSKYGGFGSAPKFPRPVVLNFLLRTYAASPDSAEGKRALEMSLFTLRKMAKGGIHDHLGGGFHRYSVDGVWHVPHFEKILYDQAQLASSYLDAYQITGDSFFATTARAILD